MWQQCENWNSIPIKQQISVLKPQEIHQSMLVVMLYLLSSFQEKTNKLKNIPQPSVSKSNPDIVQSAKTIPSPKILLLTWSSFPNGLPQKREWWSFSPFPGSSWATNMLWVSVCLMVLPVGVSCMWKHVWHQLLVLPACFPMCLMIAKVLLIHLEE